MESFDANRHRAPAPPTGQDDPVADALLGAVGLGDVRALGAFYDRTAPAVFRLLRGALGEQARAEQAMERVYLQLWRIASRFDAERGSARALLLRAVHHEIIQYAADGAAIE